MWSKAIFSESDQDSNLSPANATYLAVTLSKLLYLSEPKCLSHKCFAPAYRFIMNIKWNEAWENILKTIRLPGFWLFKYSSVSKISRTSQLKSSQPSLPQLEQLTSHRVNNLLCLETSLKDTVATSIPNYSRLVCTCTLAIRALPKRCFWQVPLQSTEKQSPSVQKSLLAAYCSVVSSSLQPLDCSLPSSSVIEVSRQDTGVGCHFLLPGIFLTQWSKQRLLHLPSLAGRLYHSATRKPRNSF